MRIDSNLKYRIANVACVGVYLYLFQLTYREIVHPPFTYFGMGWNSPGIASMLVVWFMNLSLAFAMPIKYQRPSQIFLAVQFLIVFLPATIVCLNASLPVLPVSQVMWMLVAMYAGLCIQTAMTHASGAISARAAPPRGMMSPQHLLLGLGAVTFVMLGCALYLLRDIFQFSSMDSLNAQRDLLDQASLGLFSRYALAWQAMVFLPAIFAGGLMLKGRHAHLALLVGLVGYVLLFGLTATKSALLAPFIILCIFLLLGDRVRLLIGVFALGLSVLICVPLLMKWVGLDEELRLFYVRMINFRMLSVPHLLYVQYLDFFDTHPLTHGSHVKVVDAFINYPYERETSVLIGEYYYPGSKMNANAGTWAQDGIAGFGIAGIVMISCVLSGVMVLLDFVARRHNPRWVGTSLAMLMLFLSNASLFTTLLTGGLGLIIIFLWLAKPVSWPVPAEAAKKE
jgi:hypothetical protein